MRLGEILIGRGLATSGSIAAALEQQRRTGRRLGDIVVEMGLLGEEQLASVLASVTYSPPTLAHASAETGIPPGQLLNLMVKFMHLESLESIPELSQAMKLTYSVVRELMEEAVHRNLVQARGAATAGQFYDIRYALSQEGRAVAIDAETRNSYLGPAPVSLAAFQEQIQKQRITDELLDVPRLRDGLKGLVFPDHYIRKLLPAINAGRTMLLFGPPGNGKTTVAGRIASLFEQIVYIPHAVEVAGQIMKVFDQSLHHAVAIAEQGASNRRREIGAEGVDERWVACRRPFAVAGGELNLDMLDLQFNAEGRFYDAPLHVKALNGIFLIDDFGRQRVSPKDLLNRWIIPLENRVDYLRLHTGYTFSLPFDELLIFSTNIEPGSIMDPALLRRIPYKIKLYAPDVDEYREVFEHESKRSNVRMAEGVFDYIVDTLSVRGKFGMAYFQPKFVCEQVAQICRTFETEPVLTQELATEALANLYVDIENQKGAQD